MATLDMLELLRVCVRSCCAAQRYMMHEMLHIQDLAAVTSSTSSNHTTLPTPTVLDLAPAQRQRLLDSLKRSIDVRVKSELEYKDGVAAHDLVTSADVLTQAVIVQCLRDAFPQLPFTIVGEEENLATADAGGGNQIGITCDPSAPAQCAPHDTTHSKEDDDDTPGNQDHATMRRKVVHCIRTYYRSDEPIRHEEALRQHIHNRHAKRVHCPAHDWADNAASKQEHAKTTPVAGSSWHESAPSTMRGTNSGGDSSSSSSSSSSTCCSRAMYDHPQAASSHAPHACATTSAAVDMCSNYSAAPHRTPEKAEHTRRQSHTRCRYRVRGMDVHTLRKRVSLYIDPIDGTGCFVDGVWEAPMSLIGVTLDGVPVMGVANRVFCYPLRSPQPATTRSEPCTHNSAAHAMHRAGNTNDDHHHRRRRGATDTHATATQTAGEDTGGVSYVWNVPHYASSAHVSSMPFMVHAGRIVCCAAQSVAHAVGSNGNAYRGSCDGSIAGCSKPTTHRAQTGGWATSASACAVQGKQTPDVQRAVLRVCQSTTTRNSVLAHVQRALQPMQSCYARGAGHKLFMLVQAMLLSRQRTHTEPAGRHEVDSNSTGPMIMDDNTSMNDCMDSTGNNHRVESDGSEDNMNGDDNCRHSSHVTMQSNNDGVTLRGTQTNSLPVADVYICPGHTIKKWDCCAPHAFLRALGGEVYSMHGEPVRYTATESSSNIIALPRSTSSSEQLCSEQQMKKGCKSSSSEHAHLRSSAMTMHSAERTSVQRRQQQQQQPSKVSCLLEAAARGARLTSMSHDMHASKNAATAEPLAKDDLDVELPDGVVAVTCEVKAEVARRMGWRAQSEQTMCGSHL